MVEGITNEYIDNAMDELINSLGVKEYVSYELVALVLDGSIEQCVTSIARHLGLPIKIVLSNVSEHFRSGDAGGFESHQLARIDRTGRGTESITAQVSLPNDLPLYGTSLLVDYPIEVRVSENCYRKPYTFIAIMAHELSHVLLDALRHPEKDNEIYADLVPIILGFSMFVEKGRKFSETTRSGDFITTHTTTYGYLTDGQFLFARDKIRGILESRRRVKNELLKRLTYIKKQLPAVRREVLRFRAFLEYLDKHPNTKIKKQDGYRIVQFHLPDYTYGWETVISEAENIVMEIETFFEEPFHYTGYTLERLHDYRNQINMLRERLHRLTRSVGDDLKVLKRNTPIWLRLSSSLLR